MGIQHLNWDQHKLTERSVHGINMDKDKREVLSRAVSGGHPLIAQVSGSNHVKIHVKQDGFVITSGTGGGGRGTANFESQLRRNIVSVGSDFPRKQESMKQFQRRIEQKQIVKDEVETTQNNIDE